MYAYAGGDPIGGMDPLGLSTVRIARIGPDGERNVTTLIDPSI